MFCVSLCSPAEIQTQLSRHRTQKLNRIYISCYDVQTWARKASVHVSVGGWLYTEWKQALSFQKYKRKERKICKLSIFYFRKKTQPSQDKQLVWNMSWFVLFTWCVCLCVCVCVCVSTRTMCVWALHISWMHWIIEHLNGWQMSFCPRRQS